MGKDKTVRAGKSKHALDKEWQEALDASASGDRLTASATNSVSKGVVSSNYIPPKPKPPRTVDDDDLPQKGKGKKK